MSVVPVTDGVRLEEVDATVNIPPFEDVERCHKLNAIVVADAEVLGTAVRNIVNNSSELTNDIGAVTIICGEVDITFLPETQI